MANGSTYYRTKVLNDTFRSGSGSTYLALYTSNPGPDDAGAEVSGNNYARVEIENLTGNWSAPAADGDAIVIATLNDLTFPAPSGGDWGTLTHWGLKDAATSGNLLIYGALDAAKEVKDGDPAPVVPAGNLVVDFS